MSDNAGGSTGGGDLPPAGWYADPTQAGQQRYWDGSQWTEHTAPGTPAGQGQTGATAGATGDQWPASTDAGSTGSWGAGGSSGTSGAGKPDTWLWQSILATVFCCLPLGIVGIVFAAQAQGAVSAGDYVTAREKAAKARTWTLAAIGIGLVLIVIWVVFVVVAGSGAFMEGFDPQRFQ